MTVVTSTMYEGELALTEDDYKRVAEVVQAAIQERLQKRYGVLPAEDAVVSCSTSLWV